MYVHECVTRVARMRILKLYFSMSKSTIGCPFELSTVQN